MAAETAADANRHRGICRHRARHRSTRGRNGTLVSGGRRIRFAVSIPGFRSYVANRLRARITRSTRKCDYGRHRHELAEVVSAFRRTSQVRLKPDTTYRTRFPLIAIPGSSPT